ncbi:hypothetical protein V8C35DRAFT_189169 [Trichoderma chlorosporum]
MPFINHKHALDWGLLHACLAAASAAASACVLCLSTHQLSKGSGKKKKRKKEPRDAEKVLKVENGLFKIKKMGGECVSKKSQIRCMWRSRAEATQNKGQPIQSLEKGCTK